jgi:hypothetical protein
MEIRKPVIAFLTASFFFTATAFAEVNFNESTYSGFVSKGDVQSAFGWNNAQLQINADKITFTWISIGHRAAHYHNYGPGGISDPLPDTVIPYDHRTLSDIGYTIQATRQVHGFVLTGVIGDFIDYDQPVLYDFAWAELISFTDGLYVNYNGLSYPLYIIER